MKPAQTPVVWFEIYVAEMERAKAFYQDTLQLTLHDMSSPDLEMWAFPMASAAPGCAGALVKMPGKDPGIGGTLVYFSCDDCATESARAVAHGGQVRREKFSIGEYGHIALVTDTEGNMIGLHSMESDRPWPSVSHREATSCRPRSNDILSFTCLGAPPASRRVVGAAFADKLGRRGGGRGGGRFGGGMRRPFRALPFPQRGNAYHPRATPWGNHPRSLAF
jgi:predicted enzyme related to lactoylglutathione lyase